MTVSFKIPKRHLLLLLLTMTVGCIHEVKSTYVKSNEILTVELNGFAPPNVAPYPCITSVTVGDDYQIVTPIAVGALFQMTTRSYQGDKYNPTQSGACFGAASEITYIQDNYNSLNENALGNGILLEVQPRTFLSYDLECTNGELSPYIFEFGITLGDGVVFPKVIIAVKQTFRKLNNEAKEIVYRGAELPTVYFTCDFARYAFYLDRKIDVQSNQPVEWKPWSTETNAVSDWPPLGPGSMFGFGNMRCNGPNPSTALCSAIYYGGSDLMELGGNNQKSEGCAMNLVNHKEGFVNDTTKYSRLVLFAVGNVDTISTAIKQTLPLVENNWGNF